MWYFRMLPGSMMENRLSERRSVGRSAENSWDMVSVIQREMVVVLPKVSVVVGREKQ